VVYVWLPPYGEFGDGGTCLKDPLFLAALTSLAVHLPADDASPVAPVVSTLSSIQGALGAAAAVAGLVGRYRSGCAQPAVVTGLHAGAALMGTAFTEINDETGLRPVARGSAGSQLAHVRVCRRKADLPGGVDT